MAKLLIVDDERIIREMISSRIAWDTLGVELVGTASNGLEAYDIIMDEYPDIVMTDIKMPGLSGIELLKKIKKINADVEFIILSGYGEFEYAQEAMRLGVQHYLLKPCNEAQIIKSVQDVMARITQKRARPAATDELLLHRSTYDAIVQNILNECIALEELRLGADYEKIYHPYEKFIDFESTPYELCRIQFEEEVPAEELVARAERFLASYAPGIPFYTIHVHKRLLIFFPSYRMEYGELDGSLCLPLVPERASEYGYCRLHYESLRHLLNDVICTVRRYPTVYYAAHGMLLPICNYRSTIRSAEQLTERLYGEDPAAANSALNALCLLLEQIQNADFLKQLVSSVVMRSASKCLSFSSLEATEFLLELNAIDDTERIVGKSAAKIHTIYERYHTGKANGGSLSAAVMEYVSRNLADSNLSLKWIAEHHLYMNTDYVSKRFLKETGQKFSSYLTDARIRKAKKLLAEAPGEKLQNIAEMVGCGNNPQYFSQLFKKATGLTPRAYTKLIAGDYK